VTVLVSREAAEEKPNEAAHLRLCFSENYDKGRQRRFFSLNSSADGRKSLFSPLFCWPERREGKRKGESDLSTFSKFFL
jgi:hypothetical protein